MLCFYGCGMKKSSEDNDTVSQPRAEVTLTHGVYGHIGQAVSFPATAAYRNKSVVSVPVSGFISEMCVTAGMRVAAGQRLCVLESKERHAVGGAADDGIICVNAAGDGIVLDVRQQTGDYVAEGTPVCTLAESSSLVFEISVPYEQKRDVAAGGSCTLELPDGTRFPAEVQWTLATMDTASQSERVVALARTPFLPEGLRVRAVFPVIGRTCGNSMILPEGAVQSDETLTRHWVMKLVGDSVAVRVPVEVLRRNSSDIEILSDSLTPQDGIILAGGYGLEDMAEVTVAEEEAAL